MGMMNETRACNSSTVSPRVSDIASLVQIVQADASEPAAVLYLRTDAISKLGQKQSLAALAPISVLCHKWTSGN